MNASMELSSSSFNIRGLFEEIREKFSMKCKTKSIGVQLICDEDLIIETDRKLLSYVLYTFLDNAVKFTNKDGLITISATMESDTREFNFSIKDNGIGINDKDMDIILGVLNNPTAPEMTSSSAGLGIGIRIAQAIICEITRGKSSIGIKTKQGYGTTVSFDIMNYSLYEKDSQVDAVPYYLKNSFQKELSNSEHIDDLERRRPSNERIPDSDSILLNMPSPGKLPVLTKPGKRKTTYGVTSTLTHHPRRASLSSFNLNLARKLQTFSKGTYELNANTLTESPERVSKNPFKKKVAMIIDDEAFILEFVSQILESFEFEVYTCCGSEIAIERANMLLQLNQQVHLVLVDFNMPEMNGAQCCKILKSESYTSVFTSAKFAAMTAQDDALVREKFAKVGVTELISKPVSYTTVEEHLKRYSLVPNNSP